MLRASLMPTIAVFMLAGRAGAQVASPGNAHVTAKPASAEQTSTIQPGIYDLDLVYGGGTTNGSLQLTQVGDSLAVTLKVGDHSPPIRSIVRKGAHLTIAGGNEGARIQYELQFRDASVSGTFTYNGDGGTVFGTRRK